MLATYIYRKILERINLSKKELLLLKKKLRKENICRGPFIKGDKMCPTTTALSIKVKAGKFKDNAIVSRIVDRREVREN